MADFVRLTDHEVRSADRSGVAGHFVAEGEWTLERLIGSNFGVRSVLVTPQRLELIRGLLERLEAETPVYVASTEVVQSIAGFDFHRGVLVSGERLPCRPPKLEAARVVVAMEQVSNPDNVGGIFRSVSGLVGPAAGGVIVGPGCCDPLYRKAIRVSMGHVFSVPFVRDLAWPASVVALREAGFRVLAMALVPGAVSLREVVVGPADRVCLLVGSEGFGLSAGALAAAGERGVIPMAADVDSLNVSVATAIALYAVGRGSF